MDEYVVIPDAGDGQPAITLRRSEVNAQEQLDQIVTAASDLLEDVKTNAKTMTLSEGHALITKLRETTGYMYSIQRYIQTGTFEEEGLF